jgi:hypothetical protein
MKQMNVGDQVILRGVVVEINTNFGPFKVDCGCGESYWFIRPQPFELVSPAAPPTQFVPAGWHTINELPGHGGLVEVMLDNKSNASGYRGCYKYELLAWHPENVTAWREIAPAAPAPDKKFHKKDRVWLHLVGTGEMIPATFRRYEQMVVIIRRDDKECNRVTKRKNWVTTEDHLSPMLPREDPREVEK